MSCQRCAQLEARLEALGRETLCRACPDCKFIWVTGQVIDNLPQHEQWLLDMPCPICWIKQLEAEDEDNENRGPNNSMPAAS